MIEISVSTAIIMAAAAHVELHRRGGDSYPLAASKAFISLIVSYLLALALRAVS